MASLQAVKANGRTYWRIVESRRVNGKPRPIPIAHLGRTADLLARLQATDSLSVRSVSHGAVAALYSLSQELGIASVIDEWLEKNGRRLRPSQIRRKESPAPQSHDGLSVGQSLVLVAIGRACHATSKRGFADWAATTSLGELAAAPVGKLSSQHFWDQMDQLPVESIAPIEREIVARALAPLSASADTVLYDATNFFTFIASTNNRPKLPARGHNKQKRHDLRQVGVALLSSRAHGIPLWHQTYGGQIADASLFSEVLPSIRQRLGDLQLDHEALTLVYDKGNVSRANQKLVDDSKFHYVAALPASTQRKLILEANSQLQSVVLPNGETVQAYRTRRTLWDADRTVVVLVSERLREGQMRGVLQHVASAKRYLDSLSKTLRRGKQKRDRSRIERDIETRLQGRQQLTKVLRFQLKGSGKKLKLTYRFERKAFQQLADNSFGRLLLITDHEDWSTAETIAAYRGQSEIEAVFAHLKDSSHLALRPQFHWTDQKLHVHVFTCLLGFLLERMLYLRARATGFLGSMEALLEALEKIRRVTIIRQPIDSPKPRLSTQLEHSNPALLRLMEALRISA